MRARRGQPSSNLVRRATRLLGRQLRNYTVSSRDSRIQFRGTWTDQDNGGHAFCTTPECGFTFKFNGPYLEPSSQLQLLTCSVGSAIYYHSRANNPDAAIWNAVLDGASPEQIDGSKGADRSSTPSLAVLWEKTGLDERKEHTLDVSYYSLGRLGGPYGELYFLE
jgi:hypothetical protein